MPFVARHGDNCVGFCTHPDHSPIIPFPTTGKIIATTTITTVDGIPVARQTDIVQADCGGAGHQGVITTCQASVQMEGKIVATVGDTIAGTFYGTIATGSSTTSMT